MTNQPTTDTYQLSQSTIDRLIPIGENTVEQVESRYPARQLASGTEVTRVAPSPTGMMHIGVLYASLISERIAHRSGGVFILRIEDTDRKREVEGARDFIVRSLKDFGITPDEGVDENDTEKGLYGPYTQSRRQEIYQTYVRQLLDTGQAYPCFATPEELESIITSQKSTKNRPGYYGQWAIWRDRPETEVIAALDSGKPFVVRFRSSGNITKRRTIQDLARGRLELPENDNDVVILKQDGLPTYHFAHAIDDTLMQTTLAIRGDEWLPSTSLHVQLCEALGFEPFRYAHIAPIQKTEGDSRRKLSKRKDPEASVSYYTERGYLPKTVIEYLLNQANSSFESWRVENPDASYTEFPFSVENLARSGGLFSIEKLDSIGAEHIA
ncbi:glutamate--tRNA ligase, partial [Candidatus Saccharibacteria bacterium]|nr:glutamate--tRNA ligase [Candidatus Saccharibacteria bacterium]